MIGQALGHYRIEAKLGEGGMGVVYRARDLHLDRPVAIKVLPPDCVSDPKRKQRFSLEARAASALNHPNILHVYDVDSAAVEGQSIDFIAMELVEGRTLDELIGRKGLPLREALKLAAQIAGGLAAAHAGGIVHRDLKPGNVMISAPGSPHPGLVKILDFGLAKLREPGDPTAATRTHSPRTEEGTILGTAAYMSPEQADGRPVDARSDVFAFGSVLYQMVTGRLAFQKNSAVSTLAAILHEEPPPITELLRDSPEDLQKLIARCLRKEPERRIQHMDDVKLALDDILDELGSSRRGAASPTSSRIRSTGLWLVAAGVTIAVGFALALFSGFGASPPQSYRFTPLAAEAAEESFPVWSPDARTIAYVREVNGAREVFTLSPGSTAPTQITRSGVGASTEFWSPDGARVYYISESRLWSVGAAGGTPQLVAKDSVSAATMTPDGKGLAFVRGPGGNSTLWMAAPIDAAPQQYKTAPFPEIFIRSRTLQFSPDGTMLAVLMERDVEAGELWIIPYPTGTPRRVLSLQPMGTNVGTVSHRIAWTADNRHLLLDGPLSTADNHLYIVDTERQTFQPITPGTGEEWTPAVSPDGDKIAFAAGGMDFDLVQIALDGSDVRSLLTSSRSESAPVWSPSGGQIAYVTNAGGASEIWLRNMQEGFSRPVVAAESAGSTRWRALERPSFSPDGQRIAYGVVGVGSHAIVIVPATGGRPVPLDRESLDHHGASWSPDGNWLAYTRQVRLGQGWELVKAPLSGGNTVRLADAPPGGSETAWSPTGEWIAHGRGPTIYLVAADGSSQKAIAGVTLAAGRPGTFGFSKDGSLLYAIHLTNRQWALVAIDVQSGQPTRTATLNLPVSATLSGFSVHPDGKSFATSVGIAKYDLWLLEGFRPPVPWWRRPFS